MTIVDAEGTGLVAQQHLHVFEISRVTLCDLECADEHLNDGTSAHHEVFHHASTRLRAEAWIRARWQRMCERGARSATANNWFWEVWEEAVDAYDPFEAADDERGFWTYAPDGELLNAYELHERYYAPIYGWEWDGADRWKREVEANRMLAPERV